jgi:hypothetical protein
MRKAGALVQRVAVVRQSQLGSYLRSVIRIVMAVVAIQKRRVSALHKDLETCQ